jgi:hypothetical protein
MDGNLLGRMRLAGGDATSESLRSMLGGESGLLVAISLVVGAGADHGGIDRLRADR